MLGLDDRLLHLSEDTISLNLPQVERSHERYWIWTYCASALWKTYWEKKKVEESYNKSGKKDNILRF